MLSIDTQIEEDEALEDYVPRKRVEVIPKAPPHERAYWVEMTRLKLGVNIRTKKPFTFNHVNGITKNWPLEWLQDMYSRCSSSENFPRLWFGLIKKTRTQK